MFAADDAVLARLREICLTFPAAAEKVSHGRPNFFTRKVFASYGGTVKRGPGVHERHDHALLFLPDPGDVLALDSDERIFVPAYVGAYGWRGIDMDLRTTDWNEIQEFVDASYRLTAGKRHIAELDARQAG